MVPRVELAAAVHDTPDLDFSLIQLLTATSRPRGNRANYSLEDELNLTKLWELYSGIARSLPLKIVSANYF